MAVLRRLLLVLVFAAIAGCSTMKADAPLVGAITTGVTDCVTTGAFLAFGAAVEVNPLGPVAACTLKPLSIAYSNSLSEPKRTDTLHATKAMWGGASANNAAFILAKLAGIKIASAVPPLIGIGVAYHLWEQGSEEREFARICAHEKIHTPEVVCYYKKD